MDVIVYGLGLGGEDSSSIPRLLCVKGNLNVTESYHGVTAMEAHVRFRSRKTREKREKTQDCATPVHTSRNPRGKAYAISLAVIWPLSTCGTCMFPFSLSRPFPSLKFV